MHDELEHPGKPSDELASSKPPRRFFSERPDELPETPPISPLEAGFRVWLTYKIGCLLVSLALILFVFFLALLDRLLS